MTLDFDRHAEPPRNQAMRVRAMPDHPPGGDSASPVASRPERCEASCPGCVSICGVVLLMLACTPVTALAHSVLRESIERRTHIRVDPENIDLQIDLTFHETPSRVERRRMDADSDGQITSSECTAYVAANRDAWREALTMTVDGAPIELMTLFEPRVDVMGRPGTQGQHRLKLVYFVRLPSNGRDGGVIELTDRLWPDVPRIFDLQVSGDGGVTVRVDQADGWNWNAGEPGRPLKSRLVVSRRDHEQKDRAGNQLSVLQGVRDDRAESIPSPAGPHAPLGMWKYALALIAAVAVAAWINDRKTYCLDYGTKRETS